MAFFELRSNTCDGHIRALSRAIQLTSRMSRDALLEFTSEKMRLCAKSDHFLVKFVFTKDFFNEYVCDRRHRCYINTKALLMPFKSLVLMGTSHDHIKDNFRTDVRVRCTVEDEINNQIVFKIGSGPSLTTLTYRIRINDLAPEERSSLDAVNRTIVHWRVEISPKQGKKERFLLSAFNNFAPDMDQVTMQCSASEIKFIGSTPNIPPFKPATSEFTHNRADFHDFNVKEGLNITCPLKYLKLFLSFVEANRIQLNPKFIFEGVGQPAHFIYECTLFKAHLVTSTSDQYFPEPLPNHSLLQIENGPNESFIMDDDNGFNDGGQADDLEQYLPDSNGEETEEDDGYNDNESEEEDLLDGNLDRLNTSVAESAYANSFAEAQESIRSEMKPFQPDLDKVREILNIDEDPEEIENVHVIYSSGSDDDE